MVCQMLLSLHLLAITALERYFAEFLFFYIFLKKRERSCYVTLYHPTDLSMRYLVMFQVYTDTGGIKQLK